MKQQLPALGIWLGRIPALLLAVATLGTLCVPALIQLMGRSTDTTFIFNRAPARLPPLPTSISAFEEFRDGLIKFVDDNFGLRAEMVQLNMAVHSLVGVSAAASLVQGLDGWVFLKEDNSIFDQFRGLNRSTDQELDAWIDTAEIYRRWLAREGIAFVLIVAPNQQTIYPEHMPIYANRVWPETRFDQLSRRLRERGSTLALIDPRPDLWAARKYNLVYHKYESHWNMRGAFVTYWKAMQRIEKTFPSVKTLQMSDFMLGAVELRWSIPPKTDIEPILSLKGKSHLTATEVIGTVKGQPVRKWTTDLNEAPDVLVYGDSFADTGLLGYFNETFRSTTFVMSAYSAFPADIIKRIRPKLVIFELAERYLARPLTYGAELESDLSISSAPPYADVQASIGAIGGYVDSVRQMDEQRTYFYGWAVDKAANSPATMIYAYYGAQAIAAASLTDERPDVTQGMVDHRAGFRIAIPRDVDIRQAGRRLRFFSTNASHKIYEVAIYPPVLGQIDEILKQRAATQEGDLNGQ